MLRNSLRAAVERMAARRRLQSERRLVGKSGFFDSVWYMAQYPDVSGFASGDPLDHFLLHGAFEHRSPGPEFNTRQYLAENPELIDQRTNALLHHIARGGKPDHLRPKEDADATGVAETDVTFTIVIGGADRPGVAATRKCLTRQDNIVFDVVLWDGAAQSGAPIAPFDGATATSLAPAGGGMRGALEAGHHEFVLILEAGDVLADKALRTLSEYIRGRRCDLVYGDESWTGGAQDTRLFLKPDWSPELLTSYDYFGRPTAIKRELALYALAEAVEPIVDLVAAEWDLKLRVAARTSSIERFPNVLCRRTSTDGRDLAGVLASHASALAAVLQQHWKRQGLDARVEIRQDKTFHATWPLVETPLVSVIVPNKNRAHLLRTCVDGLYNNTSYRNFELIVVDNGSTEADTLALYRDIEAKSARIVAFDEEFNSARACPRGAAAARGQLLLFLNNDIEMTDAGWLEELVRQVLRPGVGIVGPKLVYPDGDIQHAGVAIGMFTLAAHVFHRAPHHTWGPFGSPDTERNWMAVTGACQLMRRNVFDLVDGYDETFLISYSDVVLCLDAAAFGYRTVYVPAAQLTHHEGASRGHTNPTNDQVVFARRVRALGIAEDPYFHPGLDTLSFIPRLRDGGPLPPDVKPLQADVEHLAGPALTGLLDVHEDGSVATAVGHRWTGIAPPLAPADMGPGLASATRLLVALLRRRRDLRASFPHALGAGAGGAFAQWVKTEGLVQLGLGSAFAPWIDAAFAARPGDIARQYLLYDDEFRRDAPLFLLPNGRVEAAAFLFKAVADDVLDRDAVWWFLVESAEDPIRELLTTWAITPAWQDAVPDGGTTLGQTKLVNWVAREFGVTQDWIFAQRFPEIMDAGQQMRLAYAANPAWQTAVPRAMSDGDAARALVRHVATPAGGADVFGRQWAASQDAGHLASEVVRDGVNVLGHFSYPSGLRISTESLVAGLRANDVGVSLRNVPVNGTTDDPNGHRFLGAEIYDTTILHIQPEPLFDIAYARGGLQPRSDRTYRIGYWYWEFDTIPASWDRAALSCDELWTATEFIADGLRKRYRQPVKVFLPGVELPTFDRLPRSYFGLAPGAFIFLFVFHMTSIIERKNPYGLIKAFKAAFGPADDAQLVIKTAFGAQYKEQYAELRKAAADANILLIDKSFSHGETLSLIACCDAYVSLHRSEGLGLSMAEAMLLGRPVVATRYSGNLEFMDDGNSLLVDPRMVTLNQDIPPYSAGLRWAEPSVDQAATFMRKLHDDRAYAQDLGARAKLDLERRLNYRAAGAPVAAHLAALRQARLQEALDLPAKSG